MIELLAVIVILAIIAVISTPIVIEIIEESKKKALVESANGILDATKIYIFNREVQGKELEVEIVIENNQIKSEEEIYISGKIPEAGVIKISNNEQIAIAIYDSGYCAVRGFFEDKIQVQKLAKEECNINSNDEVLASTALYLENGEKNSIKNIVISGNSVQNVTSVGKNKFIKMGSISHNQPNVVVTYNQGDQSYTINGKASVGNIALSVEMPIDLQPGTDITFSRILTSGSVEISDNSYILWTISNNDATLSSNKINESISNLNQTVLSTSDKLISQSPVKGYTIYMQCLKPGADSLEETGIVFNNYKVKFQIEEGTSATEYESYIPVRPSSDYPSEIRDFAMDNEVEVVKTHSNILNGLDTPLEDKDFWNSTSYATPLNDGWVHLEYDNTIEPKESYANIFISNKQLYKFKENTTYTILAEFNNVESNYNNLSVIGTHISTFDLSETLSKVDSYEIYTGSKKYLTFTSRSNFNNVSMALRTFLPISKGAKSNLDVRFSIVEGEHSSFEYEPYNEQKIIYTVNNPLRSLTENVKDKMIINNVTRKAYVERNIGVTNLIGDDTWQIYDENEEWIIFTSNALTDRISGTYEVKSNYFSFTEAVWNVDREGLSATTDLDLSSNVYIKVSKKKFSTIAAWKAWLDSHNVVVYYQLKAPLIEEIFYQQIQNDNKNVHLFLNDAIRTNIEASYIKN